MNYVVNNNKFEQPSDIIFNVSGPTRQSNATFWVYLETSQEASRRSPNILKLPSLK